MSESFHFRSVDMYGEDVVDEEDDVDEGHDVDDDGEGGVNEEDDVDDDGMSCGHYIWQKCQHY